MTCVSSSSPRVQSGDLPCLCDGRQSVSSVGAGGRGRQERPGRRRAWRPAADSGSLRNPSQPLRSTVKTPCDEVSWQFFSPTMTRAVRPALTARGPVSPPARTFRTAVFGQLVAGAATWFQKNPRVGFKNFSAASVRSMQEGSGGGNGNVTKRLSGVRVAGNRRRNG